MISNPSNKGLIMNKLWVWVGFPLGIGVLLLLLVIMGSEAGAKASVTSR